MLPGNNWLMMAKGAYLFGNHNTKWPPGLHGVMRIAQKGPRIVEMLDAGATGNQVIGAFRAGNFDANIGLYRNIQEIVALHFRQFDVHSHQVQIQVFLEPWIEMPAAKSATKAPGLRPMSSMALC